MNPNPTVNAANVLRDATTVTVIIDTGAERITMKVEPHDLKYTLTALRDKTFMAERGVLSHIGGLCETEVALELRGTLIPEPLPTPDSCDVCKTPAYRAEYLFGYIVCDDCMNPKTEKTPHWYEGECCNDRGTRNCECEGGFDPEGHDDCCQTHDDESYGFGESYC